MRKLGKADDRPMEGQTSQWKIVCLFIIYSSNYFQVYELFFVLAKLRRANMCYLQSAQRTRDIKTEEKSG